LFYDATAKIGIKLSAFCALDRITQISLINVLFSNKALERLIQKNPQAGLLDFTTEMLHCHT